jgi:hypothetical protein
MLMRAEFGSLVDEKGIPMDAELFRSATAYGIPSVALSPDAGASQAYTRIALNVIEPSFREALASGEVLPEKIVGRICDIAAPSAEDIATVTAKLNQTKHQISEAGYLNERMNVPTVNLEAMALEQAGSIVLGSNLEGDTGYSKGALFALVLGVSFFMGATGLALGWAIGADKLTTLFGVA